MEFNFSKYIISNAHIFINQSNTLQELTRGPWTSLWMGMGYVGGLQCCGLPYTFFSIVCARCTTDVNSVDFAMGCTMHNAPLCHLLPYYGLCTMHNGPLCHLLPYYGLWMMHNGPLCHLLPYYGLHDAQRTYMPPTSLLWTVHDAQRTSIALKLFSPKESVTGCDSSLGSFY